MIISALQKATVALDAFLSVVGVDRNTTPDCETSHRIHLALDRFPCDTLTAVPSKVLIDLHDSFHGSMTLVVTKGEDAVAFELSGDVKTKWESIETELLGLNDCRVELTVYKKRLLDVWEIAPNFRIYFDRRALEWDLKESLLKLADLSQHLWRDNGGSREGHVAKDIARSAVVVVAKSSFLIQGPLLTVVGNDCESLPTNPHVSFADVSPEALEKVWLVAVHELRWDGMPYAVGLTPLHLKVDVVTGPEVDTVSQVLRQHCFHLCSMWLADRVSQIHSADGTGPKLLAQISGDRAKAQLVLDRTALPNNNDAHKSIESLGHFLYKVYASPNASDRLKLARIAVSRALQFESPENAGRKLIERAQLIWEDHDWQWTQFAGGKIDAYLKEERELEDRVSKAVEAFDTRIADMIKMVSDTALASIGALIGSMVASVFSGKFNETVFQVGMYAYAGYIVAFPAVYGLTNLVFRFLITYRGFQVDAGRIAQLIGEQRVKGINGKRVGKTAIRFIICFCISVAAYLSLVGLCFVAVKLVPPLMRSSPQVPPIVTTGAASQQNSTSAGSPATTTQPLTATATQPVTKPAAGPVAIPATQAVPPP